jgi:zinc transporter ZupT
MIALTLLILLTAVVAGLYSIMRRQPDRRTLWRTALYVGIGTGVARAGLASLGWYLVERSGGPLQIPAFALVMMAWPEGVILAERRLTPAPLTLYVQLSLLLIASTVALVAIVAFVAGRRRNP